MPVTRFGLEGYGVRRAGSFAGKAGAPSPVEAIFGRKRRHRKSPLVLIRDEVYANDDADIMALAKAGFEKLIQ